jgi:hypothetical protein
MGGGLTVWTDKPRPRADADELGQSRDELVTELRWIGRVERREIRRRRLLVAEAKARVEGRRLSDAELDAILPLEPPWQRGGRRRGSHCPKGHRYDRDNLKIDSNGRVRCRTCTVARVRAWRERRKEQCS